MFSVGDFVVHHVAPPSRYDEYLVCMHSTVWHYHRDSTPEEDRLINEEKFYDEHAMTSDELQSVERYFYKSRGMGPYGVVGEFDTPITRLVLYFSEIPIPERWWNVPSWEMNELVRYEIRASTEGSTITPRDVYNIARTYFASHDSTYLTKPPLILVTSLMRMGGHDDTGDGLRVELAAPEHGEKL